MYYKCNISEPVISNEFLFGNHFEKTGKTLVSPRIEKKYDIAYSNKKTVNKILTNVNQYSLLFHESKLQSVFDYANKYKITISDPSKVYGDNIIKIYCDGSYWLNSNVKNIKQHNIDHSSIASAMLSVYYNEKEIYRQTSSLFNTETDNNFCEIYSCALGLQFVEDFFNRNNLNIIVYTDSFILFEMLINDNKRLNQIEKFKSMKNINVRNGIYKFEKIYNSLINSNKNIFSTWIKGHADSNDNIDMIRHSSVDLLSEVVINSNIKTVKGNENDKPKRSNQRRKK